MPPRPRIHLIATGGTIAGTAPDPTDTRNYTAGVLTAEQLIASVPPLKDLAEISVEQLYNLDSKDMTPDHWLGLARATQAALARDDVDGVVITHGTDTMEESAFFLDLVLPPGKPVVFTGAMRPATALSADGPMNLYDAVGVAAHEESCGVGVVVVMHGEVHAARYVTKVCTARGAAFVSPGLGPIGWATPPRMAMAPRRIPSFSIDLDKLRTLPSVEVLTVSAGSNPDLLSAIIALGVQAVVLALPGCGSIPEAWKPAIQKAQGTAVWIVILSRVGPAKSDCASLPPDWRAEALTPTQARIIVQLVVAAGLWKSSS